MAQSQQTQPTEPNEAMPIEVTQKAEESVQLLATYLDYKIESLAIYANAGEDLKQVKAKYKELDLLRKSLTKPLDESKRRIMDFFRKPLSYLKKAEELVSSAMIGWARKQERIRKAEEDRLRELQRKEATRLAKLAAAAEKRGDKEKAAEFDNRSEEVSFAAPIIPPKTTKIAGLAMTETWKFRILDINRIPREYMIPNEVMLGQTARTTKGLIKVEGVEFYSTDTVRGTRT